MTVKWNNFSEYIQANILDEEKQITKSAKFKYGLWNTEKAGETLNKLIDSAENNESFFGSSSYHSLPKLTKTIQVIKEEEESDSEDEELNSKKTPKFEDKEQIKSWKEIFPKPETTFLGVKSVKNSLTNEEYRILESIFKDWKAERELLNELENEKKRLDDKNDDQGVFFEAMFLNLDKDYKITNFCRGWLEKYEKLSLGAKEKLKNDKKGFKQLLNKLEKLHTKEKKETAQKSYWQKVKDLEWKTIGTSIGIMSFLAVIFLIIYRKIRR